MNRNRSLWAGALIFLTAATLAFLCALPGAAAPADTPSIAPVNPEFMDYMRNMAAGRLQSVSDFGHPLGRIPAPVSLSHIADPAVAPENPALATPATYDLRALGLLTPVKDQRSCGSCWIFAACGAMESTLLPGETWDFSENHMKNTSGFDWGPCEGGNEYMAAAYLTRWSGPVLESQDPYRDTNGYSPSGLSPQKHVQEVLFLPDRSNSTDNGTIKAAVTAHGALYTSMYWDDTCYSATNKAYYYNGTHASNHAVCIVGWDDNYDRSKFALHPSGNGAFLIRNSWGPGWGDGGYFYVSYYDTNIGKDNTQFLNIAPPTDYAHIYQYDPLGLTSMIGYGKTSASCANIFTAAGNESVTAVGFYTLKDNTSYEVSVYTDPTNGPLNTAGYLSYKVGTIATTGFHPVPLNTPVALAAGQRFSVVVKLVTPGYNYPIPMETPETGYSSGATANPGESWISSDGRSWSDLAVEQPNANVCVKAYTQAQPKLPLPTFSPSPGAYAGGQRVAITSSISGTAVHYTRNGVDPTVNDPVLSVGSTIAVDTTTTLKAAVWKTGWQTSEIATADYRIAQQVPLHLAAGWNMVSVPLVPAAGNWSSWSAALPGAIVSQPNAWDSAAASYLPGLTPTPGQGCWVKAAQAANCMVTGFPVPSPAAIALRGVAGGRWNLVGNPFPVALTWNADQIQIRAGAETRTLRDAAAAGWIRDYGWCWDGTSYSFLCDSRAAPLPGSIGSLPIGGGLWLRAFRDCQLVLASN